MTNAYIYTTSMNFDKKSIGNVPRMNGQLEKSVSSCLRIRKLKSLWASSKVECFGKNYLDQAIFQYYILNMKNWFSKVKFLNP